MPTMQLEQASPPIGSTRGGTLLTLTGAGFLPGSTVQVGHLPASEVNVFSSTTLTARVPENPGVCGPVPITLVSPDGRVVTRADLFSYSLAEIRFESQTPIAMPGAVPQAIAAGDLNGDGKLDFATALQNLNAVRVFYGMGNGRFSPGRDYPMEGRPARIKALDLNGDGNLDLVATSNVRNDLSVLIADGSGSFLPTQYFPMGAPGYGLAVGDLDGDEKPDILVANTDGTQTYTGDTASIFLNDGQDGLRILPPLIVGKAPKALALGDFDHDGRLDLAVTNEWDSMVSVFPGMGNGNFGARSTYPAFQDVRDIIAADIDHDGNLDLITSNADSQVVSVLRGNSQGRFTSDYAPVSVGSYPSYLLAADVDCDGYMDVLINSQLQPIVSLMRGNAQGRLSYPIDLPADQVPTDIAVCDVDGDGKLDILVSNSYAFNVSVLLNRSL